jgi:uncharacterized protein (TIGR02284 family)
MALSNDDVVDVLNDLIETAKDGEFGFTKSAERVQSPALRSMLQARAADCRRAATELQALVADCGGTPADSGSVLGAMHRGWVSVKDALTIDSDHAVMAECERGEDTALARYRKALKSDLPPAVRDVVTRQMAGAQRNHDQVKALRDSTPTQGSADPQRAGAHPTPADRAKRDRACCSSVRE